MNNSSILNGLLQHDKQIVEYVYRQFFPRIKEMVLRTPDANNADAEDVFMNSLELIYLKINKGVLQLKCQFSNYLYAICYRKWCKELRRRNRAADPELFVEKFHIEVEKDIQTGIEAQEQLSLYRQKFSELNEISQKMLRLSFTGLSGEEIATKLGLRNATYVYKKCSLSRKKLIYLIRNDARYIELGTGSN